MAAETGELAGAVHRFILLSDIAGSSHLAEAYSQRYYAALKLHNVITEQAVARCGGSLYKHTGDGYIALFETARACLSSARELAVELAQLEPLAADEPLLVRIALHAGELRRAGGEYYGAALNRASRICQVCHPGQVLLSVGVAADASRLPAGSALLDLGLHYLRDLNEPEHLYQLDDECFVWREFPPLATLNNRPNNLLQQPNLFVGRARELRELEKLLSRQRLVTITAPGGYGKSRLAAQLCADLLSRFECGVFFVELAPIAEHTRIVDQLATATGFHLYGSREPQEQIIDYLREKELLLCFDNFEHVLTGAPLVSEILRTAPLAKIVITTREPLRISGEQVYALPPLPVDFSGADGSVRDSLQAGAAARPPEYSEAAQLFADRAALVNPGFALESASGPLVEQICAKLEGVPLAIELAAAWTDCFTLPELLAELSQQLELTARLSDVPERHRSVRASLDWSWQLLSESQRRMLMVLSTFRGGCFVDAAGALLQLQGLPLRQSLAALADKGWLYSRHLDGQTRFFIRDMASHGYAFEKLRETRASMGIDSLYEHAVMAHACYFSELMDRQGPELHAHGQLEALRTIKFELLNIYEALDTLQHRLLRAAGTPAVEGDAPTLLLPIARWLWEYLDMVSDYKVMRERYLELNKAGGQAGELQQIAFWILLGCGRAHYWLSAYDLARVELDKARELAEALGDRLGVALALSCLGSLEHMQSNYAAARALQSESLRIRREFGDRRGVAQSRFRLAIEENLQRNYSAAREHDTEALAILREIGDRYGIALSLNNLGNMELEQRNCAAARALHAETLAIRRQLGDRRGTAVSLNSLGSVESAQGYYAAASRCYTESLAILRELGERSGIAHSLYHLGFVQRRLGNFAAARALHVESLAILREIGGRSGIADSLNELGLVDYLEGNYAAAGELFAESLAIRREIDDHSSIPVSLANLGAVAHMQGGYATARKSCTAALAIDREIGTREGLCDDLAIAGCMLAAAGLLQSAASCLYGVQQHAAAFGYAFDAMERGLLEQGLATIDRASAGLPPAELERVKAQPEVMTLGELAQFALDELEELNAISDAAKQQADA